MANIKKTVNQRVTIKDIASLAQVSIGTVDRVLHNRGEVNQETHNRILSLVDELGYTPNLLAKSLALKKTFSIGVLIPSAGEDNPFWNKPLEGFLIAEKELSDFNARISLFNYDLGDERSFMDEFNKMLSIKPDGIIMAPYFHDVAMKKSLICKDLNIPVIFIDNNLEKGQGLAYFGQDSFQSGKVAAKLMHYGLPKGSTVLIVNLAKNKAITHHMHHREKGFISYFITQVPEHKIKTITISVDLSDPDELKSELFSIMKRNPDLSGIFVTNSRVYKVAELIGNNRQIILTGYDLIDANVKYLKIGLIDFLIGQKPQDQGYKSIMAMFNHLMNGKKYNRINYSPIEIITKENIDYY